MSSRKSSNSLFSLKFQAYSIFVLSGVLAIYGLTLMILQVIPEPIRVDSGSMVALIASVVACYTGLSLLEVDRRLMALEEPTQISNSESIDPTNSELQPVGIGEI